MRSLQKTVNVGQPVVDRQHVDINMPQSSTQVRYINENASTSKILTHSYWEIMRSQMG
jgi:hypothetical protein